MRKANHSTRAYFEHESRLKGFLVTKPIKVLMNITKEQLEVVARHENINMEQFTPGLERMQTNKDMVDYLGLRFPCLCIYVMK